MRSGKNTLPRFRAKTGLLVAASLLVAAGLFVAACSPTGRATPAPSPTPLPTRGGALTPYAPTAAAPTPTLTAWVEPTALPSPTPTPRTHVVQKGEDMFGIALRYRISLDELKTANPTVNPNFLSIGSSLVIPASGTLAPPAVDPSDPLPSPTALPVETGRLSCTRTKEGGMWCFLPVRNPQPFPLEGLIATFRIAGGQGESIIEQNAFLPLDVLPPGATLPLTAYFPAPVPEPLVTGAELLSALPSADDGRYLPVRMENQKVFLAEDQRSAEVTVDVYHEIEDTDADRVWVAAVAYDAQGNVVGVRRWENQDTGPLPGGQVLPVRMTVYSVSGAIERVEVYAEARP